MKTPTIYVLCEHSGAIANRLQLLGANVRSFDLLPSSGSSVHTVCDLRNVDFDGVDMVIAFPPCTYLAKCGLHYCKSDPYRIYKVHEAFALVSFIWHLPVSKIVIENPAGWLSTNWRKPSQYLNPFMFGDEYRKEICLFTRGVPPVYRPRFLWAMPPYKSVANHVNSRMSQEQKSVIKSSWSYFPKMSSALANHWFQYSL